MQISPISSNSSPYSIKKNKNNINSSFGTKVFFVKTKRYNTLGFIREKIAALITDDLEKRGNSLLDKIKTANKKNKGYNLDVHYLIGNYEHAAYVVLSRSAKGIKKEHRKFFEQKSGRLCYRIDLEKGSIIDELKQIVEIAENPDKVFKAKIPEAKRKTPKGNCLQEAVERAKDLRAKLARKKTQEGGTE